MRPGPPTGCCRKSPPFAVYRVGTVPPLAVKHAEVPLEDVTLGVDPTSFYRHGYVLMEIDGPAAHLSYFQYDADKDTENKLFEEDL